MTLTNEDKEFLSEKGITETRLNEQLRMFAEGFPYLKIIAPATVGNGIIAVSDDLKEKSLDIWEKYLNSGGKILKMVPASGAASRMFKDLFSFLNGSHSKPHEESVKFFFNNIESFPFFPHLNFAVLSLYGKSVGTLMKEGRYKDIMETLLEHTGLNYGQLPKALLRFHKTYGGTRTPLEEHLAEGAEYATGKNKTTHLHFTVSNEHYPLFVRKTEEVKDYFEKLYNTKFDISFSEQKPSTDTIAVLKDGTPYRENGKLVFRPGGHGALIENLNDLDADVIFIKNIDNVVPDSRRDVTITFKKVIGGILVATKNKIDRYCKLLATGNPTEEQLNEMLHFLRTTLCVSNEHTESMGREETIAYLLSKFNRPIRVCGMVKNEGEPGGGPFLTVNPDGSVSPQILESTQIDPNNKEAMKMLKESTHFNPVDLVVCTKDWNGNKFNLLDYVDPATGFISDKSKGGTALKALELPGLWNGAMSNWNTLLVEVPSETFNPVKTVNDLLREAHK
ncbi:MAG: DUF4301 family protein [Muribaculaceae bacterium]|nr:DUF4301 family protein [Muribaculaceae bacterium]